MAGKIPSSLRWLAAEPGGSDWLAALPSLVVECSRAWGVRLGEPFDGNVSYVSPGVRRTGAAVVLKISFPHIESEMEAAALAHWNGQGAAALLEVDPVRRALLLERCVPGTMLWEQDELTATESVAGVFARLWQRPAPAGDFVTLASASQIWSEDLSTAYEKAGQPFELELLDEAMSFMDTARPPKPDDVVLHQDLHGGNVIRRDSDWVAIDPKPLVGEREFDLASYIRDRRPELSRSANARDVVRTRMDWLSRELDLERDRVKGWALAHALAWGFERGGEFYSEHVLVARLIAAC